MNVVMVPEQIPSLHRWPSVTVETSRGDLRVGGHPPSGWRGSSEGKEMEVGEEERWRGS